MRHLPDEDFKWILHTTPDEDFQWILHTTPDEDFKWILHTTDHWSKFNLAFPLVNKGAHDVAEALEKYVFPVMGLPSTLHSDNGREFVNPVIAEILNDWPGQVQLVSGWPRHPQSQGVVEQAHYTLERMLSAEVAEQKTCKPPWSRWLPHIVCKCNFCSLQCFLYTIQNNLTKVSR